MFKEGITVEAVLFLARDIIVKAIKDGKLQITDFDI
jgi:hypothetical protein